MSEDIEWSAPKLLSLLRGTLLCQKVKLNNMDELAEIAEAVKSLALFSEGEWGEEFGGDNMFQHHHHAALASLEMAEQQFRLAAMWYRKEFKT